MGEDSQPSSSRPLLATSEAADAKAEVEGRRQVDEEETYYGIGKLFEMAAWEWQILSAALACQIGQIVLGLAPGVLSGVIVDSVM